ncbi:MAG TPA: HAMP domain-containing sensor histidine kinase [Pedobacter sp.]|nr:HAMP domain-containing sensor histidine kinase [Pedobacter sp.]
MNQKLDIEAHIAAINAIDAVASMLEVICKVTGMGFAAIARITEDRWIACSIRDEINFGLLPGDELDVKTIFSHEIPQHNQVIVVGQEPQSYISIPIFTKKGQFFGTLCAIGSAPSSINKAEIIGMFELFADLISFHLHTQEDAAIKEQQLIEAKNTAELRDKVIAILGHDLRNPVAAILNVAELLLRLPVEERVKKMATIIQRSTNRMKELIENMLDFARGHLGNGIKLDLCEEPLEEILLQIVEDYLAVSPAYKIEISLDLKQTFSCDGKRIAQLLGNLLSNALTYGKSGEPVQVLVYTNENQFVLSVTNKGNKITDKIRSALFQPFYRGDIEPSEQGLGLGLYIASEIAKAHHGKLDVTSSDEFTCFTFTMPI